MCLQGIQHIFFERNAYEGARVKIYLPRPVVGILPKDHDLDIFVQNVKRSLVCALHFISPATMIGKCTFKRAEIECSKNLILRRIDWGAANEFFLEK